MAQSPDPNPPETPFSTLVIKGVVLIGAIYFVACFVLQLRLIAGKL